MSIQPLPSAEGANKAGMRAPPKLSSARVVRLYVLSSDCALHGSSLICWQVHMRCALAGVRCDAVMSLLLASSDLSFVKLGL